MTETWRSLLANLAVVAVFVTIWTQVSDPTAKVGRRRRALLLAALLAIGTIANMSMPITIRPGVFLDLRATMISLSAFFGGPFVGVAVWLAATVFRLSVGGVGAPSAVVGITIALAVGLTGRLALRGRQANPSDALLLATATAIASTIGFIFLPADLRNSLFFEVAPVTVTLTFVAVTIAGLMIVNDERRRTVARQNELYAAVLEALPNPLNVKDLEGRFLAANSATAQLMQASGAAALIGHSDFDFYPRDTAQAFRDDEVRVMESGVPYSIRQHVIFNSGTDAWLSTTKAPFRDRDGNIIGLITHNRDITERKRLEDEFALSQQRLSDALANMADGLVMFDRNDRIVICNPQYLALFPRTAALRVPGASLRDILRLAVAQGDEVVPDGRETEEWIEDTCASLRVESVRELRMADGRWLQARVRPTAGGSLTVISDITPAKNAAAEMAALNQRLDALANTDGLTGLLNRRAFDEMLSREFARSVRAAEPLSLLLVDVDRFKAYNDTYGHPQGDECLKAVAACLKAALKRPADSAARYGGEEFVALLPDTDADGALALAEAFRNAVRDLNIPHSGSEKRRVTVTVGIATRLSDAGEQPGDFVRRADRGLYAGKEGGRDRVYQERPQERPSLRVVGS